jgi:short-subunit dehydrogenase
MAERVIVITGASSGIGAALARRLGRQGEALVLAARRKPELDAVAADSGNRTVVVPADVTVRADVERIRDAALEAYGQVDVWVNNAGRGIAKKVADLTDGDLDAMMAVNVKSALYGIQAILPHFQARGRGHIVNVSSFLGRVPFVPIRSAYTAAKAALNALSANLRMELRSSAPGVQVSVVMPGVVSTDFAQNALGGTVPPATSGPGQGAASVQSAEEVASIIARLIEQPVPEVYTNPAHPSIARDYYQDVGAFEARLPRRPGD